MIARILGVILLLIPTIAGYIAMARLMGYYDALLVITIVICGLVMLAIGCVLLFHQRRY